MIWSKGEWVEESCFALSGSDRGVLQGWGAFETMLAMDGTIQHWPKHNRRLMTAVDRMGLADVSGYDVPGIARELCEKNACARGSARLRLTVTAGAGTMTEPAPGANAMVWLSAHALVPAAATCDVVTLPWTRVSNGVLTGWKTTSYAENMVALRWARQQGADEGIFFNDKDELCEACTANVFVCIEGVWHTPGLASGCLPGVMREVILETARNQGVTIHESAITRDMWAVAQQVCLSSALRGVTMVRRADGRELAAHAFPVVL